MYKYSFSPQLADCPAPLVSSESVSVPVEASIEDLHNIQAPQQYVYPECIQSDSKAAASPLALEEKLNQELQYHRHGNYNCNNQSDPPNSSLLSNSNPFLPNPFPDHAVAHFRHDMQVYPSSVHSFTKAKPVHPASQDDYWCQPSGDHALPVNPNALSKPNLSTSVSTPSLPLYNQEIPPSSLYDRQQSCPTCPVMDTSAPDISLGPSKSRLLQDSGARLNLCIRSDVSSVHSRDGCSCP